MFNIFGNIYSFIAAVNRGISNIIEARSYTTGNANLNAPSTLTSGSLGSPIMSVMPSTSSGPGVVGALLVIPEFSNGTMYTVDQLRNRKPGNYNFEFNYLFHCVN